MHIIGLDGGIMPTGFGSTPWGASVRAPYGGTRPELTEVFALARSGSVDVHVERDGFDEAVAAYARLHEGTVRGRAVIVP